MSAGLELQRCGSVGLCQLGRPTGCRSALICKLSAQQSALGEWAQARSQNEPVKVGERSPPLTEPFPGSRPASQPASQAGSRETVGKLVPEGSLLFQTPFFWSAAIVLLCNFNTAVERSG